MVEKKGLYWRLYQTQFADIEYPGLWVFFLRKRYPNFSLFLSLISKVSDISYTPPQKSINLIWFNIGVGTERVRGAPFMAGNGANDFYRACKPYGILASDRAYRY
jgi:hypothetical protein